MQQFEDIRQAVTSPELIVTGSAFIATAAAILLARGAHLTAKVVHYGQKLNAERKAHPELTMYEAAGFVDAAEDIKVEDSRRMAV